ncbi:MAG: UvrD-helicase domain-containing protein [Limisphaerales bacterium]
MDLTSAQQKAVAAHGNVLVKAGAGAGKTRTLVERCLARVLDATEAVSIDQVLMVTFTEAAAAEMRNRLREELERKSAGQPDNVWLSEQLALLDTAPIGTLHRFCRQLVQQHFYVLGLDPQVAVLEDASARLLAAAALETILQQHYAGGAPNHAAVQELILAYGRGRDQPVRELVLKLHEFTQTLDHPQGWFDNELRAYREPRPQRWENWWRDGIQEWRQLWLPVLEAQPPENVNAHTCAAALAALPLGSNRAAAAATLEAISAADQNWPHRKKTALRLPVAKLFEEAAFWRSLVPAPDAPDPLVEDWAWVQPHMIALLELTQEFAAAYRDAKRDQGALDFHDLEQFALRLLWDPATQRPTSIAEQCRHRMQLICVDEYQDINAAQDKIIEMLSREGADANRFLVGDVKQSIYRFRLANPRIFQAYESGWRDPGSRAHVIPLVENFRSHETILHFVNRIFVALMRPEIGGLQYDQEAKLVFGNSAGRAEMRAQAETTDAASSPLAARVEFHLRLKGRRDEGDGMETEDAAGDGIDPASLQDEELEARLVAERLRALHAGRSLIWDSATKSRRPVEWRDMVILLRSPRHKAESYAKEFTRWGVPLIAPRRGFYEGTEITDLLSLLHLLDNPLQDVPLLAVLRSPLAGLTVNDLAAIRLTLRKGCFWTALRRFHDADRKAPAWAIVDAFLQRLARWREMARQEALSRCLETVLDETYYLEWLATQPRGQMRCANVQRLLAMTRRFDRLQRQGLFRFLKFVEAQQAAGIETEPAAVGTENAVQLMSIHQSKGLEFPVVVLADLGKLFNLEDLKKDIILDEFYGLGPQVQPPHTGQRYPSLPYWLARQRQRQEALGEELRLLYVAMTRACDKLILAGTASRKTAEERWPAPAAEQLATGQILAARNCLDWLGPLMASLTGRPDWLAMSAGSSPFLAWRTYGADDLASNPPGAGVTEQASVATDADALASLAARVRWRYPHAAATLEPAKTSVSALRRRLADEMDGEARPPYSFPGFAANSTANAIPTHGLEKLSATEIGIAHHRFLQFVSLDRAGGRTELEQEAVRMEREGVLQSAEKQSLDFTALAAFWNSELGKKFRAGAAHMCRELPFTARFGPAELAELHLAAEVAAPVDDFVVVQGVVDWALIRPKEIWVLDFKTDQMPAADLPAKIKLYQPQLKLYAAALDRVYRRPVTGLWLHFLALDRSVSLM